MRLPTLAELKQARGTKHFAEYALEHFLKMNVKYGAIDFIGGSTAHNCARHIRILVRKKKLKIWTFIRGSSPYVNHGKATLYLVRDLKEKTHK